MNIRKQIVSYKETIADALQPIETVSETQARDIIANYTAAVEPNFIVWLAAAHMRARSAEARYACNINLEDEIGEDHQGMLQRFARAVGAEPEARHYRAVGGTVRDMRSNVASGSGLEEVALMAVLENTSQVFVPYLAELADKLGSNEFTYTDAHGIADIKHAEQFLDALDVEANRGYTEPDMRILHGLEGGTKFVIDVFNAHLAGTYND